HQQLERELAEAQGRSETAHKALEAAREELRRTPGPETSPETKAKAAELVAAREAQLETAQEAVETLRVMLEMDNLERTIWDLRFAAYGSGSAGVLRDSEHRLDGFTHRLDLWKEYYREQLEVSSRQIELQETRVASLSSDSNLLPLARERLAALRERDELLL